MLIGFDLKNWSLNCEGLTSSCLTISKNSTIITLHAAISYWLCNMTKDCSLINLFIADEIEIKFLCIKATLQIYSSLVNLNTLCASLLWLLLFWIQRSNTNANFYIVLLILLVFKKMIDLCGVSIISIIRDTRASRNWVCSAATIWVFIFIQRFVSFINLFSSFSLCVKLHVLMVVSNLILI